MRDRLLTGTVDGLALVCTAYFAFLLFRPGHATPGEVSWTLGDDVATWDVRQYVGNLLALAGVGILLGRRGVRTATIAMTATVLSVGIELTQHLLADGRVASIDDVVVNVAGATVAGVCAHRISCNQPKESYT